MDIFIVASWLGGIAFALSGFLVGIRHRLDIMGIFIVSMLTANGGGAVRDLLVNRTPAVLLDSSSFYMVLGVMAVAYLFKVHRNEHLEKSHLFVVSDSLGLVAFSVTGALVGVEAGLSIFGVMVLSFITAAGGGIIRDLLVNEVPAILSSDFYGTIALLLGASIFLLDLFEFNTNMNVTILFVAALLLRMTAYMKKWKLPRITDRDDV